MVDDEALAKESDYGVLLPCTPDEFSDFISGILGNPQRLERRFFGEFLFSRDDLESTFHLVDQRVKQQNDASLLQFTVEIIYSDNSSVLLNSFEDFKSYTEIRPLVSIGCVLTWAYLIKFRDKSVPEKQTVELSIDGGKAVPPIFEVTTSGYVGNGVLLRVEHTARTWGADIEALLAGHIEQFRQRESPIKRWVHNHSGKVGGIIAAVFLAIIVSGAYFATRAFSLAQIDVARVATRNTNLAGKINFIIERFSAGAWTQYNFAMTVFLLLAFVAALALAIWATSSAERPQYTFVLLTKGAEERRQKILRAREHRWMRFVASAIGALILGVLSNYVFGALVRTLS